MAKRRKLMDFMKKMQSDTRGVFLLDPILDKCISGNNWLQKNEMFNCVYYYSLAIDYTLSSLLPLDHKFPFKDLDEIARIELINELNNKTKYFIIKEIDYLRENVTEKVDKILFEAIMLYLNIVVFLVTEDSENKIYKDLIENRKIRKAPLNAPVLIIAGGASLMDKTELDNYRETIKEAMTGFKGTIISGGTTDGIPGLVGQVKEELEKQNELDFSLIAYLPKILPEGANANTSYDYYYKTDNNRFSILEIVIYWCDIVCSGINPADVLLIGIDGGKIALMEYMIALSLGAKVGLVADSGRAVSTLFKDKEWKMHRNLFEIE